MNNQIAVLLPHYNNPEGLRLTLNSLLKETAKFILYVFDDGSDDLEGVRFIINEFSSKIKIVLNTNSTNLGITKTLNEGLKYIRSLNKFAFIARLDAGDVCMNNRLELQVSFLIKNIDIGLVGSWVKFVNMDRKKEFEFRPPKKHSELKKIIHLYNPFVHPSVMFRIEVIDKVGLYPENYPALEDHAYFFEIMKHYKVSVIDNILLEYELNPKGVSFLKRKTQAYSRIKLLISQYKLEFYPTIGLLRAFLTYLLPQSLLNFFKKHVFYKF